MTNITSVWVQIDSMNQAVWKSEASAWKTNSRMKNVMKSKTELIGPNTMMNFLIKPISHFFGVLI